MFGMGGVWKGAKTVANTPFCSIREDCQGWPVFTINSRQARLTKNGVHESIGESIRSENEGSAERSRYSCRSSRKREFGTGFNHVRIPVLRKTGPNTEQKSGRAPFSSVAGCYSQLDSDCFSFRARPEAVWFMIISSATG